MNAQLLLSAASVYLNTVAEINRVLLKAQMEKRDVTDDEVKALVAANDAASADLVSRLRQTV